MRKRYGVKVFCGIVIFFILATIGFYFYYRATTIESVNSQVSKKINAETDAKEGKSKAYKAPKTFKEAVANTDDSSKSSDVIVPVNPVMGDISKSESGSSTQVGSSTVRLSLNADGVSPATIRGALDTYKTQGNVNVVNAKVISYFDKALYGQTLVMVQVDGGDKYKIDNPEYKNEDVYICFATKDKSEVIDKLNAGMSININASSSDMLVKDIGTGHGKYGDMLVIFGQYNINK